MPPWDDGVDARAIGQRHDAEEDRSPDAHHPVAIGPGDVGHRNANCGYRHQEQPSEQYPWQRIRRETLALGREQPAEQDRHRNDKGLAPGFGRVQVLSLAAHRADADQAPPHVT